MSAPAAPSRRLIALVTWREVTTRVRTKSFVITTAVLLVALIAMSVIAVLVGDSSPTKIALTPATASLQPAVEQAAASVAADVDVSVAVDEAAGEAAVADGDVSVLVAGTPEQPEVVVDTELSEGLEATFALLAKQLALDDQISELGGDPSEVAGAIAGAEIPVRALQPQEEVDDSRIGLGFVVGILIYLALIIYGQAVAQGVVEEKTSRVVELLLATLRPWHLLTGKVLGIGAVGLLQLLLTAVPGAIVAAATDTLSLSLGATVGTVAWGIVWFLIGFLTFALLFAGLGALVSRQEDIGTAIGPIYILIIAPYVIGASVLPTDPHNELVRWLSMVPFCAPTLMPWRIALGVATPGEIAFALVVSLATLPLLVWLAARIYERAVLRTGTRVSLREALWRA